MKILLWPVHFLPNLGGLEVMVYNLARHLIKQGHQVAVISNTSTYCASQDKIYDEFPSCQLPFIKALAENNLVLIKKNLIAASAFIQAFQPDVINIHGWFEVMAFYQIRVLEKINKPMLLTVHGLLEQALYNTQACTQLLARAHFVTAVSQAVITEMQRYQITHRQPFELIYNGLPYHQTPTRTLNATTIKLLMVGRLSEEKGFETAWYSLRQLIKKYPQLQLTLIGGGKLFHKLAELKNTLGLNQYIKMIGWLAPEKVFEFIDDATLILVPSTYESFGLVALQAAMRGRPVIASEVGGLMEVIKHQETGYLIPANNSDALAQAIDDLLSQPEILVKMGQEAQQRAQALFSIENTTMQYLNFYQRMINSGNNISIS